MICLSLPNNPKLVDLKSRIHPMASLRGIQKARAELPFELIAADESMRHGARDTDPLEAETCAYHVGGLDVLSGRVRPVQWAPSCPFLPRLLSSVAQPQGTMEARTGRVWKNGVPLAVGHGLGPGLLSRSL